MKKLIIPISALFLAACGAANSPADAPTGVNSDTVLDDRLFQEATTANDLAKCEEIADSTKKDECKMVVQSFLTTEEAVAKLDTSLCEDIVDERYRKNCNDMVDEAIEEKEAYEKYQLESAKKENQRLDIETEAVTKGDLNICNQIEDEGQKANCKYNVISELDDLSLCNKIGNEDLVKLCKETPSTEGGN